MQNYEFESHIIISRSNNRDTGYAYINSCNKY